MRPASRYPPRVPITAKSHDLSPYDRYPPRVRISAPSPDIRPESRYPPRVPISAPSPGVAPSGRWFLPPYIVEAPGMAPLMHESRGAGRERARGASDQAGLGAGPPCEDMVGAGGSRVLRALAVFSDCARLPRRCDVGGPLPPGRAAGDCGSPPGEPDRSDGPSSPRHGAVRGLPEFDGGRPPRPAPVSQRGRRVPESRRRLHDDSNTQLSEGWPRVPAVLVRAADVALLRFAVGAATRSRGRALGRGLRRSGDLLAACLRSGLAVGTARAHLDAHRAGPVHRQRRDSVPVGDGRSDALRRGAGTRPPAQATERHRLSVADS